MRNCGRNETLFPSGLSSQKQSNRVTLFNSKIKQPFLLRLVSLAYSIKLPLFDSKIKCPSFPRAFLPTAKPIEHKLLTFMAKQNCRSQPCYSLHKQSVALRGDNRRSRRVLPLIMPLRILDGKANRMSKMLVLSVCARHSNRPRHCEVGSVFE